MIKLFIIIFMVLLCIYFIKKYYFNYSKLNYPKYISSNYPIIGLGLIILKNMNRIYEYNLEMHEKNGWIFSWKLFNINLVSTCDPNHIKYILNTNFNNFEKGPIMRNTFNPFLGNGIFAVDGLEWKYQRKSAQPFFKIKEIKNMFNIFNKYSNIVIDLLDKNTTIDIQDLFMRYTMDTICDLGFDYELNSLKYPTKFLELFDYIQSEINKRGYNQFRKFNLIENYKFNKAINEIDNFVYNIIKERRKINCKNKNDLLSKFINDDNYVDNKYLRDIILSFLLAGKDTTANLLTWTFYEIIKNNNILDKLLEEITLYYNTSTFDINNINWDNIKKMPYLKVVLKEVLRLHPSVPANFKYCINDDYLPNRNNSELPYFIKNGTYIQINSYTLHRIKNLWGDNANEFYPERWLNKEYTKNLHPYQYIPFHSGPRRCLGEKLALNEASILICKILLKYKFTFIENKKIQYSNSLTLPIQNGLFVNIIKTDIFKKLNN
jgi:cytochrome P450